MIKRLLLGLFFLICTVVYISDSYAQVASVQFPRPRIQYKKNDWNYIITRSFKIFYTKKDSLNAKYVAHNIENIYQDVVKKVDYPLDEVFTIILYNSYEDYISSNIAHGNEWDYSPITKIYETKIVVYYHSDLGDLKKQLYTGIARVLIEKKITGKILGDYLPNIQISEIPSWMTDSYVTYLADYWNINDDNYIRKLIEDEKYKNFFQFLADDPLRAGRLFWYYVMITFGSSTANELFFFLQAYKDINRAFVRVTKQKYKPLIKNIFPYLEQLYAPEIEKKRNRIRARTIAKFNEKKTKYLVIKGNPNQRRKDYALVEFKKGRYYIKVTERRNRLITIKKYGSRLLGSKPKSHYPLIFWTFSGNKLSYLYPQRSNIVFETYDIIKKIKSDTIHFNKYFSQIQSMKFMINDYTLLISGVRNGQSDIFSYDLRTNTLNQITNDIYDDIDPSYGTFNGNSLILFASNRPSENIANSSDIQLAMKNFNIYSVNVNSLTIGYHHISQLTKNVVANNTTPLKYDYDHFTYTSDDNGIVNRYIGNITTNKAGIDSQYYIDDVILVNPDRNIIAKTLKQKGKTKPDSIKVGLSTKDYTNTFQHSNYNYNIYKSGSSGHSGVNEITIDGSNYKTLSKLDVVNFDRVQRVNNKQETYFSSKVRNLLEKNTSKPLVFNSALSSLIGYSKKDLDSIEFFKNFFINDYNFIPSLQLDKIGQDINQKQEVQQVVKKKTKQYVSPPFKYNLQFSYLKASFDIFNNDLIGEIYQPYTGTGPIYVNGSSGFNSLFIINTSDLFENLKFNLGYRFPTNLANGSDFFFEAKYLKYYVDIEGSYVRSVKRIAASQGEAYTISQFFLTKFSIPLSRAQQIIANVGLRKDVYNYKTTTARTALDRDSVLWNYIFKAEYIYNNSVEKEENILLGTKAKIFVESYFNIARYVRGENLIDETGKEIEPYTNLLSFDNGTYNIGFDIRHYEKIYRNFIFATRFSAGFSFGEARIAYFLGGSDGWLFPRFNNSTNNDRNRQDIRFMFQTLALNLRGYEQNAANGNNNFVINNELRLPIISTIFNRPSTNTFLRHLQSIVFLDIGMAWSGALSDISIPVQSYSEGPITISIPPTPFPFLGGYGVGLRSRLFGYFVRLDRGWPLGSYFTGGIWYLSLGLDF